MLDAFHALSVVISKDSKASPGETEILRYTLVERKEVSRRISHMLSGKQIMNGTDHPLLVLTYSVLSASLNMEYPLNDTLPRITHVRDRFLAKIFECRQDTTKETTPTDEDYELVYCYGGSLL